MATLLSKADGNFTASTTWGLVDSTSELDVLTAQQATSTSSDLDSATFTPGAITVDGVALRTGDYGTRTGTLTVTLRNSTDGADVASITCNVTDIPEQSWVFFKFGSSQLLVAGKAYLIRVRSATSAINLYRNATTNNWCRLLRTTTEQAPASGDKLIIVKEITGAAAVTTRTVTMDNTNSTSFGPTVSGGPPHGLHIGAGALLTFGTAAATNYQLKLKGVLYIAYEGELRIGNEATPIPADSTALLQFDMVSNLDSGVRCFGTWTAQGAAKTAWTRLSATAASSQAVLSIASTTGWRAADTLIIGTHQNYFDQAEEKVISTVDSGTQVTLTTNLTNSHEGNTAETACYILSITRNIQVFGQSTSVFAQHKLQATNMTAGRAGTCSLRYVQFKYADWFYFNSIFAATTPVTPIIEYCTWYYCSGGVYWEGNNGSAWKFNYNIGYNLNSCLYSYANSPDLTSAHEIKFNLFYKRYANWNPGMQIPVCSATITDNVGLNSHAAYSSEFSLKRWGGNPTFERNSVFASGSNQHFYSDENFPKGWTLTMKDCAVRRCANEALNMSSLYGCLFLDNFQVVGAGTALVYGRMNLRVRGGCFRGESGTYPLTTFWNRGSAANAQMGEAIFYGVDFKTGSAPTNFFDGNADAGWLTGNIIFDNCKISGDVIPVGSAITFTKWGAQSSMSDRPYIGFQKYDQTANDHRRVLPRRGECTCDTAIYKTAAPSERVYPRVQDAYSGNKMHSGHKLALITSGDAKTVSVWVRKSSASDSGGANYTGAAPRLRMRHAQAVNSGESFEVTLATMTAGVGSWEQLTGSISAPSEDCVVELWVDCDGTAGWINVDDWGV